MMILEDFKGCSIDEAEEFLEEESFAYFFDKTLEEANETSV